MARVVAIELGFPPLDVERAVLIHEAGIGESLADMLLRFGQAVRRLEDSGLREVASTRTLIAAGLLVAGGLSPIEAATAAIAGPLTDDPLLTEGLVGMIQTYLTN